jgi:hypothetical protein
MDIASEEGRLRIEVALRLITDKVCGTAPSATARRKLSPQ